MLTIEPFEIRSIVTGSVRLDGGAMFGVVPKTLWSPKTDVDDLNRILLFTRTLLAIDRANRRVVLVDTGAGSKWSGKSAGRFAVEFDAQAIPDALASAGLTPEDVTDVIITHLHFDHNGGMTEYVDNSDGATRLRFPQATHWVHRKHLEHAQSPTRKDRASFIAADFAALLGTTLLELVDGDEPDSAFDGLSWFISHGHTPYQLLPVFGTGVRRIMFVGDLIPTINHLGSPWVMAYDLNPLTSIAEKESVCKRCIDEELLLAFPHDPTTGGVALAGTPDNPRVAQTLDL